MRTHYKAKRGVLLLLIVNHMYEKNSDYHCKLQDSLAY